MPGSEKRGASVPPATKAKDAETKFKPPARSPLQKASSGLPQSPRTSPVKSEVKVTFSGLPLSAPTSPVKSEVILEGSDGSPKLKGKTSNWLDDDLDPDYGKSARQIVGEKNVKEGLYRLGPRTTAHFRSYLKRLGGNVLRAFRLFLDHDGNGVLTYDEFGPAVRAIGYEGSIKQLWRDLDPNDDGTISLYEVCPKTAKFLQSFKVALTRKYPTAQTAWRAMTPGGQKSLTLKSFSEACDIVGWKGNTVRLFKMLDAGAMYAKHIYISDIEWLGEFETGAPEEDED
jgi:hypothetical protein